MEVRLQILSSRFTLKAFPMKYILQLSYIYICFAKAAVGHRHNKNFGNCVHEQLPFLQKIIHNLEKKINKLNRHKIFILFNKSLIHTHTHTKSTYMYAQKYTHAHICITDATTLINMHIYYFHTSVLNINMIHNINIAKLVFVLIMYAVTSS